MIDDPATLRRKRYYLIGIRKHLETETLKDDLYGALAKRGHPRDGIEKAMRSLLRDAGQ
jgi:hypothetical protein